jgi:diguanylate cyclase (GGDEF)-like protein/PAS domain S-box-containing protein
MQGPVSDLVLLTLLVLFFGLQQWRRPQADFRFWFAGWIFILVGYFLWAVGEAHAPLPRLENALCFDFTMLGIIAFVFSAVAKDYGVRRALFAGLAVTPATMAMVDIQDFLPVPRVELAVGLLLGECVVLAVTYHLQRQRPLRKMILTFAVGAVYGSGLAVYALLTPADNLANAVMVQALLTAAVLFAGTKQKSGRSVLQWSTTFGFLAWAAFYLLRAFPASPAWLQNVLDEFWNFPKYFVGGSMILYVLEDAAEDKARAAETFRDLYEDFRLLFDTHPHPMWICDTEGGHILTANETALKQYGYTLAEFQALRIQDLEVPPDGEAEEMEHMLGGTAEGGVRERHRHRDGSVVWVNRVEREIAYLGQKARLVIARNITDRLKLDRELSFRAQHDALTGLPNRQLLEERLEQCLQSCRVEERRAAVLTIDVDHFKLINDTYGHLVGDECLKEVAARLKSKIRKVDTIARTGGEEFTAVVSGLSKPSDAEKVAASLMRVFEAPVELAFGALGVTVSVGVAIYPDDATDATSLRRLSDEAMYRAKRAGRNRAAYSSEKAPVLDFKKPEIELKQEQHSS